MNRCKWPSERGRDRAHREVHRGRVRSRAAQDLSSTPARAGRSTALTPAACSLSTAVAPRKMYAGVAALTRLLGTPEACIGNVDRDGVRAFAFISGCAPARLRSRGASGQPKPLRLARQVRAYDVMGNESHDNARLFWAKAQRTWLPPQTEARRFSTRYRPRNQSSRRKSMRIGLVSQEACDETAPVLVRWVPRRP